METRRKIYLSVLAVIVVCSIILVSFLQHRVIQTCDMEMKSNYWLECQNYKPEFDKEEQVKFYWHNSSGETDIFLNHSELQLPSDWRAKSSLKIITHGFQSSSENGPGPLLKKEYLALDENYNVILVDWSQLSNHWLIRNKYCQAARNTEVVGRAMGKLINMLVSQGVTTWDKIHLIGHSLGAHVSGIAGAEVGAGKIGRITGLDPAGPSFYDDDGHGDLRLSPDDAKFVDVIHTDSDVEVRSRRRREIIKKLGFGPAIGHADFYPNGGHSQPGCSWKFMSCCSHSMAYEMMAETIQVPYKYPATSCNSFVDYTEKVCDLNSKEHMGEHLSHGATGKYFLVTHSGGKRNILETLCTILVLFNALQLSFRRLVK